MNGSHPHTLVWALSLICLVIASVAKADTLLEVFREAQQFDPRWSGARNVHLASRQRPAQGFAGLLPSVAISSSAFHYNADSDYPAASVFKDSQRYYETFEYGLTVTHPLFRRENFALYQQAIAQANLGDAELSLARAELMLRVAQAYFDALAALDNIMVSRAEVEAFSAQLSQAEDNLAAGVAAITDVYEAQSRHALATAREISAKNEFDVRRQALRRIMGRYPRDLALLSEEFVPELPVPNDIEKWVKMAREKNEQLKVQQQQVEVSRWDMQRARAAHYPLVDLVVNYSNVTGTPTGYGSEVSDQERIGAGIQIQVPLYQGGRNVYRLRETMAMTDKALDDLEDRSREVEVTVRQIFLALVNGAKQIRALERALISSEGAREASHGGLSAGVRTRIDVLNAEQQVFNTKRELSKARYDYLLNILKLKALAGTVSEDDLRQTDALLTVAEP